MNCILRYYVLPWRQLSGLGNWSYAVLTEWIDPRDQKVSAGSTPPKVFTSSEPAKQFARDQARAWPYRSEATFLTESGHVPL